MPGRAEARVGDRYRSSLGSAAFRGSLVLALLLQSGCGEELLNLLTQETSITVQVVEDAGQSPPVSGARVTLLQLVSTIWETRDVQTTGASGVVEFGPDVVEEADEELAAGVYRVSVTAQGFDEATSGLISPTFDDPDRTV